MAFKWTSALLLVACAQFSSQVSTPESPSYVAAVVEFASSYVPNNGPETLQRNVDKYVAYIKTASAQNADIIVFPEDGLTTLQFPAREEMGLWTTPIPTAAEAYVPCKENKLKVGDTVKKLSCAALENKIYVVVNMAEDNSVCDEEKCNSTYYNTNVVFDRSGKIIARYRKTHLFNEPQFDTMPEPEVVTFETDFGVTFGTFICFDILFKEPATNLTRIKGVTDIAYSTAWFSETPFLTAAQTQYGWAYAENVNLLASGYNNPKNGNTGSGIFLGRKGIAEAVMSKTADDKLIVVRVPKIKKDGDKSEADEKVNDFEVSANGGNSTDGITLLRENLTEFTTVPVTDGMTEELCHNGFCCTFNVRMPQTDKKVHYRAVVFNGARVYGIYKKAGVKVCAVVQCATDETSSCGSVLDAETTFSTLEITGTFDNYEDILTFPTVLNTSLLPIQSCEYDVHRHDDHGHFTLSTRTKEVKNIVTFGVYARIFDRDDPSAAPTMLAHFLIVLSSIFVLLSSS